MDGRPDNRSILAFSRLIASSDRAALNLARTLVYFRESPG